MNGPTFDGILTKLEEELSRLIQEPQPGNRTLAVILRAQQASISLMQDMEDRVSGLGRRLKDLEKKDEERDQHERILADARIERKDRDRKNERKTWIGIVLALMGLVIDLVVAIAKK